MRKSKMITLRVDETLLNKIDCLLSERKEYKYRGELIRAILSEYLRR